MDSASDETVSLVPSRNECDDGVRRHGAIADENVVVEAIGAVVGDAERKPVSLDVPIAVAGVPFVVHELRRRDGRNSAADMAMAHDKVRFIGRVLRIRRD